MRKPAEAHCDIVCENRKVDEIVWGNRVRIDVGDIESLARNIERETLLQPIVVSDENVGIAGYRRWCAYRLMGIGEIPCNIISGAATHIALELAENGHRKPFTPEEIGKFASENWETFKGAGIGGNTRDIIGDLLGVSGPQVERCKKIFEDGDPEIQKQANERGARAGERALSEKKGQTLPKVTVERLDNIPIDTFGKLIDKHSANLLVSYPPDVQADLGNAAMLAQVIRRCVSPEGVALVGVRGDRVDKIAAAYVDEGLRLLGMVAITGGESVRVFLRLSNNPHSTTLLTEHLFSGKTFGVGYRKMVEEFSKEGELVIDPILGDGYTYLACDGRRFAGADLDPKRTGQILTWQEDAL